MQSRAEVDQWIARSAQESQSLEFKRADALSRSGGALAELVKDVTGMANAVGGRIVDGVAEARQGDLSVAASLGPVTDAKITREWITQVVTSNTGPSFRTFEVHAVQVDGGRVIVIDVASRFTARRVQAQANTASSA